MFDKKGFLPDPGLRNASRSAPRLGLDQISMIMMGIEAPQPVREPAREQVGPPRRDAKPLAPGSN